jgi:hypothetical protein
MLGRTGGESQKSTPCHRSWNRESPHALRRHLNFRRGKLETDQTNRQPNCRRRILLAVSEAESSCDEAAGDPAEGTNREEVRLKLKRSDEVHAGFHNLRIASETGGRQVGRTRQLQRLILGVGPGDS